MSFRPCLGVGRYTKPLQEYGILIQVLNSSSYYAQVSGQEESTNKIINKNTLKKSHNQQASKLGLFYLLKFYAHNAYHTS